MSWHTCVAGCSDVRVRDVINQQTAYAAAYVTRRIGEIDGLNDANRPTCVCGDMRDVPDAAVPKGNNRRCRELRMSGHTQLATTGKTLPQRIGERHDQALQSVPQNCSARPQRRLPAYASALRMRWMLTGFAVPSSCAQRDT